MFLNILHKTSKRGGVTANHRTVSVLKVTETV